MHGGSVIFSARVSEGLGLFVNFNFRGTASGGMSGRPYRCSEAFRAEPLRPHRLHALGARAKCSEMIRQLALVSGVVLVLGCNRATSEANSTPVTAAVSPSAPVAASTGAPTMGASQPVPAAADATPTLLAVGTEVPDVAAAAQDGKTVKLRALKGKPVVLYFYPKDDTPGCTIEAKGIRDQYAELNKLAVVLGVSTDSAESHKAFAEKFNLPFELLDDSGHALATAFGVPVNSGHAKRVTFIIDAAGKVRKVFPNVNPDGHAAELILALKALG